jgi:hypothetical protein
MARGFNPDREKSIFSSPKVKNKGCEVNKLRVKFTLEHATKAQRGSISITPLFL